MATTQIETVLAGTKGFALALLAPVAERLGAKPHVAQDPAHALLYCQGPASVVVVEFLGEDSLSAIKDLVLEGGGVRIVAAVPPAHAAAEGPLRALGVDAVRWDGATDAVLAALDRQLVAARSPARPAARAAPAPRPAAAPPRAQPGASPPAAPAAKPAAPARPQAAAAPGPALTPPPARPAVARPAPGPALTPSRPQPAVAPAGPALTPRPQPAVAGPALTPSRPQPAVAPAGPALTPARPQPAVARPAAGPALTPARPPPAVTPAGPALTPARPPAAVAPRAAAAPTLAPSRPPAAGDGASSLFDAFDEDLLVAAESLGPAPAAVRAAPAASPPRSAAAAPAAPAPVPEPAAPDLFEELRAGAEPALDLAPGEPATWLAAPPPDAPWPTAVPGPVEAADALGRALLGGADRGPLSVAAEVVAGLSELERAVFSGVPQPFDTEAIRRAAVMRVRVAVALATAPPPGGAVDQGSVSAFLAEIDALLSDVNALAAAAPAEVQPSLEAMRNALVKEAIDFSEAVQRTAPAAAFSAAAAPARASIARAAETRLLSVSKAEQEADRREASRQRKLFVALGIALVAGAGFHGYRYLQKRRGGAEPPTRSSAPAGTLVVAAPQPGESTVLRSRDGQPFSREELKRIVDDERLKGNAVREVGPGVVLITPAQKTPPQRAATQGEVKP